MHFIDVSIILAFIANAIASGLKNKDDAGKNLEEYFLAGRSLPGWKAGISMAATQFAADTPLLVMGLIATSGIFSLWRLWIYALSFLLMGFVLAGQWRRANVLTDAELTEIRYGNKAALWLRGVKAVYFGTIINCTVMAMVLLAATRIAEPFLLWNLWLPEGIFSFFQTIITWVGIPFTVNATSPEVWILSTNNIISIMSIIFVTTLYSTTGGLRSVVATDVMQFFIMMIATALYAGYVIYEAGGMGNIISGIEKIYASHPNLSADNILAFTPSQAYDLTLPLFAVLLFQWIIQMNSDGTGYLAQRSMACKNEKEAKIAAIVFSFCQILLRSLFWLPIGLGLIVLFPIDGNPENLIALREAIFVTGINELLPIGIKGLLLTGMLAALASTIDTHLNWGSSYWSNDIYKRIWCEVYKKKKANDRTLVMVARISNIGILFIALFIMAHLNSIQKAWQASLILGASMGIPLLLRWFWWRMNSWGEIIVIIGSVIITPFLIIYFPEISEAQKLLLMASISIVLCLFGIFFFGPEDKKVLDNFYQTVKPMGVWKKVSGNTQNEDVKRLKKAILSMLLCAISLFSLLIGFGSLIAQSPGPTWFPSTSLWIILNILLGLGLIPIWYKRSFK